MNRPGVGPDVVLAGPAVRQQEQRRVFVPGMDQGAEVSSQVLGRQVNPLVHLFQVGLPVWLDQPQDLAGLDRCRGCLLASGNPWGDSQHGRDGQEAQGSWSWCLLLDKSREADFVTVGIPS